MLTQQVTWHIDEVGYHPKRLATTLSRLKRPSAYSGSGVVCYGVVDGLRDGVLDKHTLVGAGESSGKPDHVACLVLELGLQADHIRFEFAEAFSHASRGLADRQRSER